MSQGRRTTLSYEAARAVARAFSLRSSSAYFAVYNEGRLPAGMPSTPSAAFRGRGWISWEDFLGDSYAPAPGSLTVSALPFAAAKAFVHTVGLTCERDFREWSTGRMTKKGGRILASFPEGLIPCGPDKKYAHCGWNGWADFLGYSARAKPKGAEIVSLERASAIARENGVTVRREWVALRQRLGVIDRTTGLFLPLDPAKAYAGFPGWNVFFGLPERMPWLDLLSFIRSLGLRGQKEYQEYRRGELKEKDGRALPPPPPNLPHTPRNCYPAWESWGHFTGTGFRRGRPRLMPPEPGFEICGPLAEARKFARALRLTTIYEYERYVADELGEKDGRALPVPPTGLLPAHPPAAYAAAGWLSWGDFLGESFLKRDPSARVPRDGYTKKKLLTIAATFKSMTAWSVREPESYRAARRRGRAFLAKAQERVRTSRDASLWTRETCLTEAKKHPFASMWRAESPISFRVACRNGWYAECLAAIRAGRGSLRDRAGHAVERGDSLSA